MTTPCINAAKNVCRALRRCIPVTAVAAAAVVSCSPLDGSTDLKSTGGENWPPPVPEIRVTLHDDAIEVDGSVPPGRVVFRVHNAGTKRHRVTLMPLPDDLPPLEDQLQGDERRSVSPVGATNTHPPGEGTAFAVDLDAHQRYGLVCYERDDGGSLHALLGMNAEFRTASLGD